MRRLTEEYRGNGMAELQAIEVAAGDVIRTQSERIAFPRRFSLMAKDIWSLQPRLEQGKGRRAGALLERPRFRAAYDFLALRCQAGEDQLKGLVDWWTELQESNPVERNQTPTEVAPQRTRRRHRRRRKAAEM